MTTFRVIRFGGEAPRVPPRALEKHMAQQAVNCDLRNGNLAPFNGLRNEWTPTRTGTIQSIYLFGDQYWFHWTQDVDVIGSPIAGDTSERTYFTGTDYPRVTDNSIGVQGGSTDYPTNSYRLGIPKPASAPTASLGVGGGCDEADKTSVTFAYTYVSAWGEEGPLSEPSDAIDYCDGQTVTVGSLVAPTGNYNITHMRIYAAVFGDYQFAVALGIGLTSIDFTPFDATLLGETSITDTWFEPPDNMIGLCMMANGFAVGFANNEIMPSVAFQPHAYPPEFRLATDFGIVGIAAAGQALVVATEGVPYLVSGADPSALSMQKLESKQACVSKRSMVDMGDWVIWASPDGLVAVAPGMTPKVVTQGLMTREQWQAYAPESIHAYYQEGKYIAFYDTGTRQGGFLFDPKVDNGLVPLDFYATGGYNDLENDALYLVVGGEIVRWHADASQLTYTWRSRIGVSPRPFNAGWGRVLAESYPVTVKVYADGSLRDTRSVADTRPFRLSGGFLADEWEVEITGSAEVREVALSDNIEELAER